MTVPIDQPDWQNPQSGMAVYAPIVNNLSVAAAGLIGPFDLSAYSSLTVWSNTAVTGGHRFDLVDADTGNTVATMTSPADALGNTLTPVHVPIDVQSVNIVNNGAVAATLNVRGTSRRAPGARPIYLPVVPQVFPTVTLTPAATYTLGYGAGHGRTFMSMRFGAAVATGVLQIVTAEGSIHVADSAETHALPGAGRAVYKEIITPANVWRMQFVVAAANNEGLIVALYYES